MADFIHWFCLFFCSFPTASITSLTVAAFSLSSVFLRLPCLPTLLPFLCGILLFSKRAFRRWEGRERSYKSSFLSFYRKDPKLTQGHVAARKVLDLFEDVSHFKGVRKAPEKIPLPLSLSNASGLFLLWCEN